MGVMAIEMDKISLGVQTVMSMMWRRPRILWVEQTSMKEEEEEKEKEEEEEEVVTVMNGKHKPAPESPPLTIVEEMDEMFLKLGCSKIVTQKLVDDKGKDSRWILASLSD